MADGGAYSCGATPKGSKRRVCACCTGGAAPSKAPSAPPTAMGTYAPTAPSGAPSYAPTAPSASPSYAPTAPTASPSYGPTVTPTSAAPTHVPVPAPSRSPTTHWLLGAAAESCSETCARDHRACHDDEADAARDRVDEWGEVAAMVAARGGDACAGGWVNGNAMAPYVNTNNGNCFGRGPDAAVAGFCGLAAEAKRRLCPCCSSGFAPSPEPTKRERPDWQGFPEEPQEDDDDDDSSYNSRAGILSSGAQAGAGVAGVALTIFAIYKLLKCHHMGLENTGIFKEKYRRSSFSKKEVGAPSKVASVFEEDRRRTGVAVVIEDKAPASAGDESGRRRAMAPGFFSSAADLWQRSMEPEKLS